ncbi:hypothetical protein N8742_02925 [Emcibacteraceae bacterium]|nr:hypothetical protein [Emcibacteraceae bacterium]
MQNSKNRFETNIPEYTPLSEALIWLINGVIPASEKELSLTNSKSFYYEDTDGENNTVLYVATHEGTYEVKDSKKFTAAFNKIFLALKNGTLPSRGTAFAFAHGCNQEHNNSRNNLSQTKWDKFFKKIEEKEGQEIPCKLWEVEQICARNNALFSPQDDYHFHSIEVPTAQLFSLFPAGDISENTIINKSVTVEKPAIGRETRGTKSKYNWDEFYTEIAVLADLDGLPEVQAELENKMMEWCSEKWGNEPSPSTIRRKLTGIYNHPRKIGGS